MQHSNSHVHEDLKFKFSIVRVISTVVNMTSEKYNVLEVSIFVQSKINRHWVRNGLYVTDYIWICPSGVFERFVIFYLQLSTKSEYKL